MSSQPMLPDPVQKQAPGARGYGYTNGGNYAGYSDVGYGYGESDGGHVQRTLQDYLLILRERIWYIVVVFLVIFSSAVVYTLSQTKMYQASSTVQIFRRDPTIMQVQQVMDNDIRSAEDLNTQIKVIESATLIRMVAERLTGADLRAFLEPYERIDADLAFVAAVLASNRKVVPQRLTLVVNIAYQHPDRFVAARVANMFAEAYLDHNQLLRTGAGAKAVDDLKATIDQQRRYVEQLGADLQVYKERNNMVSLDSRKDIVNETLKQVNSELTRAQLTLSNAEIRLNQVRERRAGGGDLTELPFIAGHPLIEGLKQKLAEKNIEMSQLRERYRARHPDMIKATNSLAETQTELQRAIDAASNQVEADYETALRSSRQATQELARRNNDSLELDRLALDYNNKEREFRTQEHLLQTIIARQTETSMTSGFAIQNARIVDMAAPPPEDRPISPNLPLNLGLGLVGGLGLGLAFAFFVAFIDDRVKSSFDIEGVIGLPLVGIIPQIKRMEQAEKAQIVLNNADRQVAESFLTLHSSLRLKDASKNARCILVTSTIPGEGKSFMTTNLALTFASHGERVAIVDCDLRKPNIHKSFRRENLRGVIDVAAGSASLEDVTLRDVHPNLDVIPAGGRARNPTQVLNSKGFEIMISDLRKKYDRVLVDTPPLAAVSDALIVLPLVDGSLFTIYFNKVRRKAAQFAAKKLLEANVPNFGAILNGLNLAVSGYYYAQYYDKSYKDYYVQMARSDESGDLR
jgi:polysaccharide biosynthesis transport protein